MIAYTFQLYVLMCAFLRMRTGKKLLRCVWLQQCSYWPDSVSCRFAPSRMG